MKVTTAVTVTDMINVTIHVTATTAPVDSDESSDFKPLDVPNPVYP